MKRSNIIIPFFLVFTPEELTKQQTLFYQNNIDALSEKYKMFLLGRPELINILPESNNYVFRVLLPFPPDLIDLLTPNLNPVEAEF